MAFSALITDKCRGSGGDRLIMDTPQAITFTKVNGSPFHLKHCRGQRLITESYGGLPKSGTERYGVGADTLFCLSAVTLRGDTVEHIDAQARELRSVN